VRALLIVCWRQGMKRSTRWAFWHHLIHMLIANPGVAEQYLAVCAHNEHFLEYRDIVRQQIEDQLAAYRHELERHPDLLATPQDELQADDLLVPASLDR
jgi:hypothetical protein